MIQAEGTSWCKGPEVSVSLVAQGTEIRPTWLDRVGEGRRGQRRKRGADRSALWTVIIRGGETEVQSGKRKALSTPSWVKSEGSLRTCLLNVVVFVPLNAPRGFLLHCSWSGQWRSGGIHPACPAPLSQPHPPRRYSVLG